MHSNLEEEKVRNCPSWYSNPMITKEMKSETRRHKLTSGNSENYGWCCKGLVWREQCFDQRIKLLEKKCILLIAVGYVCGVTENRSRKTEVVHWVMVGWNWSRRNMIRISSRELKKKNKTKSLAEVSNNAALRIYAGGHDLFVCA